MALSAVRVKRAAMMLTLALPALVFFSSERSNATGPATDPGEDIFEARCVNCHGHDGGSRTTLGKDLNAPDLRSDKVQKLSNAELAEVIARGKGEMPAFRKKLRRDQIQQVVLHIRGLAR